MRNVIRDTCRWFVTAKQQPEQPTPNTRQIGFYIGMQMEEMAEKLEVFFGRGPDFIELMHAVADDFKKGAVDPIIQEKLVTFPGRYKELLDADMDLMWVTIGAARAQGADVEMAYQLVNEANHAKFVDGVAQLAPDTGRVLKPAGWKAPDLTEALHEDIRNQLNDQAQEDAASND